VYIFIYKSAREIVAFKGWNGETDVTDKTKTTDLTIDNWTGLTIFVLNLVVVYVISDLNRNVI